MDLLGADRLRITTESIVLSEKQHAVAFFALTHRHTGAVPERLGNFSTLVFVMAARAECAAELVLVMSQTLEHNSSHTGSLQKYVPVRWA